MEIGQLKGFSGYQNFYHNRMNCYCPISMISIYENFGESESRLIHVRVSEYFLSYSLRKNDKIPDIYINIINIIAEASVAAQAAASACDVPALPFSVHV